VASSLDRSQVLSDVVRVPNHGKLWKTDTMAYLPKWEEMVKILCALSQISVALPINE
jgi:hypothetical protein